MYVSYHHEQCGKPGPARCEAELSRLLDAVDRIRAAVRQADDLGTACLCPQEEGREVSGFREWCIGRAEYPPARRGHELRRVARQQAAKGIIGGDKEPGVPTFGHQRTARPITKRPGVIGPM